jgi:hypothetical protein
MGPESNFQGNALPQGSVFFFVKNSAVFVEAVPFEKAANPGVDWGKAVKLIVSGLALNHIPF